MELLDAANRLEALGNPTRLAIVRLLVEAGGDGLAVGDIQRELAIPGSTLSHHLSKLAQVGLIRQLRESRVIRCQADFASMQALMQFLMDKCCSRASCC
ncbi:MAG: helix-turn-helix transcriptional regulator [Corallincola sp.]|nr:helix-turn-helix transcriptional regulator [Corallincola sp.]